MRHAAITLSLLAILIFGFAPAYADSIRIFNTGVNDSGGLLAEGSADPHYFLLSSADANQLGPDTYVVMSSNGYPVPSRWLANGPNSMWIAPVATMTTAPGGLSDGIYIYRTTFDLTGFNISTTVLSCLWSTDNAGLDILINGISLGFATNFEQFEQGFASFNITSGFVHGINTLDFVVKNGAPGYYPDSPTGLRVEITGTADRAATSVPEPSSLILLSLGLLGTLAAKFKK